MSKAEPESADLYDFVPWDEVAEKAARQDWLEGRGYKPLPASAIYFRGPSGCNVRRYAHYLRVYRLTISALGVRLDPIPGLKSLGLVA